MKFIKIEKGLLLIALLSACSDSDDPAPGQCTDPPTITIESISEDNECLEDNGQIVAAVTGGQGPFEFSIGQKKNNTGQFKDLPSGNYTLTVTDASGCTTSQEVDVPRGDTGISYSQQIKSIITTNCAVSGCHNGDNGTSRDWTVFANVKAHADRIKTLTQNKTMPPGGRSITEEQIALIACWVDDGANNN